MSKIEELDTSIEKLTRKKEALSQQITKKEQEVETAQRAFSTKTAEAAKIRGQISEVRKAAHAIVQQQLSREVEDYKQALDGAYPPEWANWEAQSWERFAEAPEPRVLHRVRIGSEADTQQGYNAPAFPEIPTQVPLLDAAGPWLVYCDEANRETALGMIRSVILRTALTLQDDVQFTLLDPVGLGQAFPMRSQLPHVRGQRKTVVDELMEVQEDIRRINRDVVGHAEGLLELAPEKRAGERFELVVLTDFPQSIERDPRSLDTLIRIANSGPRAGRYLIVMVRSDQDLPRDFQLSQFKNPVEIDCTKPSFAPDGPPSAERQGALLVAIAQNRAQTSAGGWDDIVRPAEFFSESAATRIETPIGDRLRVWFGEERDERPCAHGIMAGQPGAGKSSLLHVIVTGLAARYGPDELRLILVDGKNGVELKPYAQLPHAEVVCLQTRPEMARRALYDFQAEMKRRYALFQEVGAQKLRDYRTATGKTMPRLLFVMDEFQQLFDGDTDGTAADALADILAQGRAAGTHILLASQHFAMGGAIKVPTRNIHLRVALALASDYVLGLSEFGAEGRQMINELPKSGHVVINDDSGRDDANLRGAVARLSNEPGSQEISALVSEIKGQVSKGADTVVVSGTQGATIQDAPYVAEWWQSPPEPSKLQEVARTPVRDSGLGISTWSMAERPIPLWLGAKFDIRGHVAATLRRAPGENLLSIGIKAALRRVMLANALVGLRAMCQPDTLAVTVIDGMPDGLPGSGLFAIASRYLEEAGVEVDLCGSDGAAERVSSLAKLDGSAPNKQSRIVVVAEPEYLTGLHPQDPSPAARIDGAPGDFRQLITKGAQAGLHLVLSASALAATSGMLHTRDFRHFSHRVVQQMSADDSSTLFSNTAAARIDARTDHPMGAMYVDMLRDVAGGCYLKSYGVSHNVNRDVSEESFQNVLASLSQAEAA